MNPKALPSNTRRQTMTSVKPGEPDAWDLIVIGGGMAGIQDLGGAIHVHPTISEGINAFLISTATAESSSCGIRRPRVDVRARRGHHSRTHANPAIFAVRDGSVPARAPRSTGHGSALAFACGRRDSGRTGFARRGRRSSLPWHPTRRTGRASSVRRAAAGRAFRGGRGGGGTDRDHPRADTSHGRAPTHGARPSAWRSTRTSLRSLTSRPFRPAYLCTS